MSLLEQSSWWLAPYLLLMLLMLHAMMEFTVSLLMTHPGSRRKPVSGPELRKRLLRLNESNPASTLVAGRDCDLESYWRSEVEPIPARLAISRWASDGRLRLLLDESRHECRLNQVSRSYFFFLGLRGWLPRLRAFASVQSGPPGLVMTEDIGRIAARSGWSVRPVLWWFQATHGGVRFLQAMTPPPLRRWSPRRFWGIVYPLSYILGMAYLAAVIGPLTLRQGLLILGVSVAWWGTWALVVVLLRRTHRN